MRYSNQRYNRESGAAWIAWFWHDNCIAESPQRWVLRTEQHDPGDGNLLWWLRANCCRYHGMAEREHLCHHCVSFVRLVLALSGDADCADETWLGRSVQRYGDGRVSCHVGLVHRGDVHRHVAVERRAAGRVRFADDSFLSARDR